MPAQQKVGDNMYREQYLRKTVKAKEAESDAGNCKL